LSHHVTGVGRSEQAIGNPPAVPRARRQGKLVRQLSAEKERYTCDWQGVWDRRSGRIIDLNVPFAAGLVFRELKLISRSGVTSLQRFSFRRTR